MNNKGIKLYLAKLAAGAPALGRPPPSPPSSASATGLRTAGRSLSRDAQEYGHRLSQDYLGVGNAVEPRLALEQRLRDSHLRDSADYAGSRLPAKAEASFQQAARNQTQVEKQLELLEKLNTANRHFANQPPKPFLSPVSPLDLSMSDTVFNRGTKPATRPLKVIDNRVQRWLVDGPRNIGQRLADNFAQGPVEGVLRTGVDAALGVPRTLARNPVGSLAVGYGAKKIIDSVNRPADDQKVVK